MTYWLVKSEPNTFSIDDLKRDSRTIWDGVRNYQARNNLRSMKKGEQVLFYHSVVEPIGIVGLAKVTKEAFADPSQFDPKNKYYDKDSKREDPRWSSCELGFVKKFSDVLTLKELKTEKKIAKMVLLQKGSRLSVQPVTQTEFDHILTLAT